MKYNKSKKISKINKNHKNTKNNRNNRNNKNNKNSKRGNSKIGGDVIDSGGFGCVFKPALLCENQTKRTTNSISKLLSKKHAIKEKNEIDFIYKKLSLVKNFNNYYLIDNITLCNPKPLVKSDLASFHSKCSALKKHKLTSDNINDHLSDLMMITMPDGGIPVDDFLMSNPDVSIFNRLNNKLINLFINGIIPMNKLFIFHGDIKDSNILVDQKSSDMYTRLIDWGLTCSYQPNKTIKIPHVWYNRPLQYNLPYSNILLSDIFTEMYRDFHKKKPSPSDTEMDKFVKKFITVFVNERGDGHLKLINRIISMLIDQKLNDISIKLTNDREHILKETKEILIRYISKILIEFHSITVDSTFDLTDYLNEVYIYNIDTWGFVIAYFPIFELLYFNYTNLSKEQRFMFNTLKNLFQYIINSANEPINPSKVISYLRILNIRSNNRSSFQKLSHSSFSQDKGITGDTFEPQ